MLELRTSFPLDRSWKFSPELDGAAAAVAMVRAVNQKEKRSLAGVVAAREGEAVFVVECFSGPRREQDRSLD